MEEKGSKSSSLLEHFSLITDPREAHKIWYPLEEVLLITVCAVIGGADGWVEVEIFGKAKVVSLGSKPNMLGRD